MSPENIITIQISEFWFVVFFATALGSIIMKAREVYWLRRKVKSQETANIFSKHLVDAVKKSTFTVRENKEDIDGKA